MKRSIISLITLLTALSPAISIIPSTAQAQTDFCYNFTRNIRYGDTGPAVSSLQTALETNLGTSLATDEAQDTSGSVSRFGDVTASAVVAFQEKYASDILAPNGITHGTGFVGASTRAKLNALYGCSSSGGNPSQPTQCPTGFTCTPIGQPTAPVCPSGYTCTPVTTNPTYPTYPTYPTNPVMGGTISISQSGSISNSSGVTLSLQAVATSDMHINTITADFNARPWLYFSTFSLVNQATGQVIVPATQLSNSNFTEYVVGQDYRYSFSGLNFIVPRGQTVNVVLVGQALSNVTQSTPVQLISASVTAVDSAGVMHTSTSSINSPAPTSAVQISNTSAVLGNPAIGTNGVISSYPISFSYTLTAGNQTIYESTNFVSALRFVSSGLAGYPPLTNVTANPGLLAGDNNVSTIEGYYIIPAGTSRTFTWSGTISNSIVTSQGTQTLGVSGIYYGTTATNMVGNSAVIPLSVPMQVTLSFGGSSTSNSTASISLDASSPTSSTVSVTNTVSGQYLNLPVLVFDIGNRSSNSNISYYLKNLSVRFSNSSNIVAAYLYQGPLLLSSASVSGGVANFTNITNTSIPVNASGVYTIKVDVSGINAGNSASVSASIDSSGVTVIDSNYNNVSVNGSAYGNTITVTNGSTATQVTASVSLDSASPTVQSIPVSDVANDYYLKLPVMVFDVKAQGDTLHIHQLTVNFNTSGTGVINGNNATLCYGSLGNCFGGVVVQNNAAVFNLPDNSLSIPINITAPFTVKVDVTAVGSSGFVITPSIATNNVVISNSQNSPVQVSGSVTGNTVTVTSTLPTCPIGQNLMPNGALCALATP